MRNFNMVMNVSKEDIQKFCVSKLYNDKLELWEIFIEGKGSMEMFNFGPGPRLEDFYDEDSIY